jgi:hypothetical protein
MVFALHLDPHPVALKPVALPVTDNTKMKNPSRNKSPCITITPRPLEDARTFLQQGN